MKKRIERETSRQGQYWSVHRFQRKAHEKEDWEDTSSPAFLSCSMVCFREKLMKKRIESETKGGGKIPLQMNLVSEKSSWKRGLRVNWAFLIPTSINFCFREKLMKKRIERTYSPPVSFNSSFTFQRKAHEKEDWEKTASKISLRLSLIRFQRKAHEKEDWEYYYGNQHPVLCNPVRFREKLMKKRIERI